MEFDVHLDSPLRPSLVARATFRDTAILIGVTGPSGAGKTTLLRALAGLEETARVSVNWQRQSSPRVMMVFREPCLFPHLNAKENITLGLQHSPQPEADLRRFATLCRCEQLLERDSHALSAGEAQRVALARALANQPDILLIDEGMGAIDSRTRRTILADVKHHAAEQGMRLVVVSHDLEDLALYADALALIEQGELRLAGAVPEVLARYAQTDDQHDYLSVLEGEPVASDPRYPYHRFDCEGQILYAHQGTVQDKTVRLAVSARQISLDTMTSHQSSQVNAFECTISDITAIGKAEVKVTLSRGNTKLYAIISLLSFDRMQLTVGDTVIARFKLC